MSGQAPTHIDLKKDRGLTIQWPDGTGSYYSIAYLRRMSPSADARELRKAVALNPLAIVPAIADGAGGGAAIVATDAELVGNYAIRVEFSDGHRTGIYTWDYLREIDPAVLPQGERTTLAPGDLGPAHNNPLGFGPDAPSDSPPPATPDDDA